VTVRFLADENLNYAVVSSVLRREPAVDFLAACAAGLSGKSDPDLLRFAAANRRILVTHDVGTIPLHF